MGQSNQNIPDLVLKAKNGDQQAMEQLYEMTYSRVYCTIQVMVKDEQETLDLLQDSYIKAFKHLNQFEGPKYSERLAEKETYGFLCGSEGRKGNRMGKPGGRTDHGRQ